MALRLIIVNMATRLLTNILITNGIELFKAAMTGKRSGFFYMYDRYTIFYMKMINNFLETFLWFPGPNFGRGAEWPFGRVQGRSDLGQRAASP